MPCEITVAKSGSISAFILGDLKPCVKADILYDGMVTHIDRVLFDTGANVTVVNPSVVPDDPDCDGDLEMQDIRHKARSKTLYCSISFCSGEIVLEHVPVQIFDLDYFNSGDIDLIIGMDVIILGELTVKKSGTLPVINFKI